MVRMKLRNLKELQGNSRHDEFLFYFDFRAPKKRSTNHKSSDKKSTTKKRRKLMKTRTTNSQKSNRPMKPTKMNLSNNLRSLKTQTNQKKPNDDKIDNFFTDLSYPTG